MIAALAAASLAAQLQTFDVRDFGAVGDGKTNCAEALQRAIDRASQSGRGVVVFPAGKFLTGTLILKSNVELRLDRGSTILGSRLRSDYSHGAMYALLRADGCHDIAITGEGEIDGQGAL